MASVDNIPLGTTPANTANWGLMALKGDKGVPGNADEIFTPTAPITIIASGSITITVPGSVVSGVGALVRIQGTNGFVTGTITSKALTAPNTTLVLTVTSSSGTGVLASPVVTISGSLGSTVGAMTVVGGGTNGLAMAGVIWHNLYYGGAAGYVLVVRMTGGFWGIWTSPDAVTFDSLTPIHSIYVKVTFYGTVAYVHGTSDKATPDGTPGYHRTWKIVAGVLTLVAEVVDTNTTYAFHSTLNDDLSVASSSYYTRVGSTCAEDTGGVIRILGPHASINNIANSDGGVSSIITGWQSSVNSVGPVFDRNTGQQSLSSYSALTSTGTDWDGYQDLYYPISYTPSYRTFRGADRRIGIAKRKGVAQTTVYYPSDDTNMHMSIVYDGDWVFYALWSEQTKIISVRKVSQVAPIVAGVPHINIGTIDFSAVPASTRLSVSITGGPNGLNVSVVRQGTGVLLEAATKLSIINYPNP
jgi:hypothetical protein